jgi:excisionase family DNA binding protein
MNHQKPRYRIEEALELLGLARSTCYGAIKDGRLKTVKDGRRTFVNAAEIDRYVNDPSAQQQSHA